MMPILEDRVTSLIIRNPVTPVCPLPPSFFLFWASEVFSLMSDWVFALDFLGQLRVSV